MRDKTRKPGRAPVPEALVQRIVTLTCSEPPLAATHWTGRAIAKMVGVSLRTVQRIWQAHQLQPHRLRTFKHSRDPDFAAKLEEIVGLYRAPPAHALVLSIDEKARLRPPPAPSRACRSKPGKAGTFTHDFVRHGTTTLLQPSTSWTAPCSAGACSAIGIKNSSASSMPSSAPCPPAR